MEQNPGSCGWCLGQILEWTCWVYLFLTQIFLELSRATRGGWDARCPQRPHPSTSWTLPEVLTPPPPGQLIPVSDHTCREYFFPDISSEPPLVKLKAISSCPFMWDTAEEPHAHPTTPSCFMDLEITEAPPEPPLLQKTTGIGLVSNS